jgi:hypothetical protein
MASVDLYKQTDPLPNCLDRSQPVWTQSDDCWVCPPGDIPILLQFLGSGEPDTMNATSDPQAHRTVEREPKWPPGAFWFW